MFEPPKRNQGQDIQIEQLLGGIGSVLGSIGSKFGGGGFRLLIIIFLIGALALWLASGLYTVGPREKAALRLFGEFQTTAGPGLHWYWPSPVGQRDKVDVDVTRRMELGFLTAQNGNVQDIPVEALMITGDLNIVNVQMVVQYKVKNVEEFLFRVDDPGDAIRGIDRGNPEGRTLKDATEMALRQVVGQRSIDDTLIANREQVQVATQLVLQDVLDHYQTGIQVLSVVLQTVRPPDEVRLAFDDVVNARVDKESRINEAKAYEQDKLPRAQGDAEQIVQSAEAVKAERVARAQGEASRFITVLDEYVESKEVTRRRLYLEAMEEVLPGITKFVVDPESGGSMLQFLPLDSQQQSETRSVPSGDIQ